jgi:subtilisin-like proprotein convertase family protein
MKNHLRKLSLLGVVLFLTALVLLPVTRADRNTSPYTPVATTLGNNAFTSNSTAANFSFANTAPINVPGVMGSSSGPAGPYPSVISVSGVSGTVTQVAVKLVNVNHTFPDDLDVLLVSPTGQNLIIMSDAGAGNDLVNATITIDDAAGSGFPDTTSIGTGTFRPTNHLNGDTFPVVAGPYQSSAPTGTGTLALFGGADPNGNWQLFIVDDTGGDSGNVNGGWELILTTDGGVIDPPCTLSCPSDITVGTDPDSCGAVVNYPGANVEGSCGTVTYSHPSGSSFPVGTTTVTVTATQPDMTTQTCTFNVTVTDTHGPSLTTSVAASSLESPFNHTMENVGLSGIASDNCTGVDPVQVTVFSNEDDEVGSDDGTFSPDAKDLGLGTLMLRKERLGSGNGRVYLIISRASDGTGSEAYSCNTVSVPLSNSAGHKAAVDAQAAAALAQCQATGGAPSGYVVVGDGPTIGSKQ